MPESGARAEAVGPRLERRRLYRRFWYFAKEKSLDKVMVPPELVERLRKRFDEAQLVELAAAIAWENYRARFNRVFGVRPVGFCKGGFCALPEHHRQTLPP